MTADLIAALRRLALVEGLPECGQAADLIERQGAEIERLRGLVAAAHRFDYTETRVAWLGSEPVISVRCGGCGWTGEVPCKDPNGSPRTDAAKAAHAGHVAAILDGSGNLAIEAATGATCAWHIEHDPNPSKVLAARWRGVPNLHDLTAIDWSTVEPVDLIIGGYPCQPFSLAGRRQGTNDARHLWPFIADALRVLRPRHAFFENVAGHVSLGLDTVVTDLAALGFDAEWTTVRASAVGCCHRRSRLFIAARNTGRIGRLAGPGLREGDALIDGPVTAGTTRDGAGCSSCHGTGVDWSVEFDQPPFFAACRRCTTADADQFAVEQPPAPVPSGDARERSAAHSGGRGWLGRATGDEPGVDWQHGDQAERGEGVRLAAGSDRRSPAPDLDGGTAGRHPGGIPAPQGRALVRPVDHRPTDGAGSATAANPDGAGLEGPEPTWRHDLSARGARADLGRYEPAVQRWEQLRGPAPDPLDGRRLNPRFVEWMMGFDPGWCTDLLSHTAALKALGNAVVPQQAVHAWQILSARSDLGMAAAS